jgi:hypothetical protein
VHAASSAPILCMWMNNIHMLFAIVTFVFLTIHNLVVLIDLVMIIMMMVRITKIGISRMTLIQDCRMEDEYNFSNMLIF